MTKWQVTHISRYLDGSLCEEQLVSWPRNFLNCRWSSHTQRQCLKSIKQLSLYPCLLRGMKTARELYILTTEKGIRRRWSPCRSVYSIHSGSPSWSYRPIRQCSVSRNFQCDDWVLGCICHEIYRLRTRGRGICRSCSSCSSFWMMVMARKRIGWGGKK